MRNDMTTAPEAPAKRGRPKNAQVTSTLQLYQGSKMDRMRQLFNDWSGCTSCELGRLREIESRKEVSDGNSPMDIVFGDGNADTADIMIVGEAPGEEEAYSQIPFIGKSGQLLNQLIAQTSDDPYIKKLYHDYNLKRRRGPQDEKEFADAMVEWRSQRFFISNAVACRPPENRTPLANEIKVCWDRLWNMIYILDPLVIIACGNSALSAVTMRVNAKISKERGIPYDVQYQGHTGEVTYPVVAIYHPSYLLRKADWRVKGGDWEKTLGDFRRALRIADLIRQQHYGTPIPDRTPY